MVTNATSAACPDQVGVWVQSEVNMWQGTVWVQMLCSVDVIFIYMTDGCIFEHICFIDKKKGITISHELVGKITLH
jgi:hypothetical protein